MLPSFRENFGPTTGPSSGRQDPKVCAGDDEALGPPRRRFARRPGPDGAASSGAIHGFRPGRWTVDGPSGAPEPIGRW